jgi:hypothetical protein
VSWGRAAASSSRRIATRPTAGPARQMEQARWHS